MKSILTYSRMAAGIVAALMALTMPAMTACSNESNGGGGGSDNSVQFDPVVTIHPDKDGVAVLLVSGETGTPYIAEVISGSNWVAFDLHGTQVIEGQIGETWQSRELPVYYSANNSGTERHAQIEFTFDDEMPVVLELTQYSPGQNVYPANNVATWPELPQVKDDNNFIYVTHLCPVNNQLEGRTFTGRNYTMCFDKTKRAAWWVAYPIHETYLGSGRPSPDPWAFDPKFSSDYQANIISRSYTGAYDRGHQIPNADRNADPYGVMCYQTFYCSNVTPQASSLNQGGWMRLEGKVRDWKCSDTLYVVTGAWWDPDKTSATTTDGAGTPCPLPDYYFKVVARTDKGNIRTKGDRLGNYDASQLKTIGFWVRNTSGQGEAKEWVKSVSEIEQLTGFTFFPSLPAAAKEQKNASSWGL